MGQLIRFLIGLAAVAMLGLTAFLAHQDTITRKLTENSIQALREAQIADVAVVFIAEGAPRDRVARLSGDLPQAVLDRAKSVVEAVPGVASVLVMPAKPLERKPYYWIAKLDSGAVTLDGSVPDQATRNRLIARTKSLFPGKTVQDIMKLRTNPPSANWANAAERGLEELAKLDNGYAELSDTIATLNGTTNRPIAALQASRGFRDGLPEDFLPRPMLEVIDPSAVTDSAQTGGTPSFSAAAQVTQCQKRLDAIMSGQQVAFLPGTSTLAVQNDPLLEAVAGMVVGCPSIIMQVATHVAQPRDAEEAQKLSSERARILALKLNKLGVPSRQIRAAGYGNTQPLVDQGAANADRINERVQFLVSANPNAAAVIRQQPQTNPIVQQTDPLSK